MEAHLSADELRERAERQSAGTDNADTSAGATAPTKASSGVQDAPPVQSLSDEERNPARDQAPIATDAQEAIIGDPGFRDEQQPVGNEGTPSNVNTPVRTSAPPPSAQSGVPLPEDRQAGVEPGPQGPRP